MLPRTTHTRPVDTPIISLSLSLSLDAQVSSAANGSSLGSARASALTYQTLQLDDVIKRRERVTRSASDQDARAPLAHLARVKPPPPGPPPPAPAPCLSRSVYCSSRQLPSAPVPAVSRVRAWRARRGARAPGAYYKYRGMVRQVDLEPRLPQCLKSSPQLLAIAVTDVLFWGGRLIHMSRRAMECTQCSHKDSEVHFRPAGGHLGQRTQNRPLPAILIACVRAGATLRPFSNDAPHVSGPTAGCVQIGRWYQARGNFEFPQKCQIHPEFL